MTGWRKRQIAVPDGTLKYSEEWDAFYYSDTNQWMDDKCSDPECHYCTGRPERPLSDTETQYQEGIKKGAEMLAKEIDRELLENLKAGEKVTCDDTEGYSIGTSEAYEEFVKKRNYDIEALRNALREKTLVPSTGPETYEWPEEKKKELAEAMEKFFESNRDSSRK